MAGPTSRAILLLMGVGVAAHAAIPIGYDAYRDWGDWAQQRIGMRAYMASTYDRRGGNEGADASHFLYQLSDRFNVTLDLESPGLLVFSRFNHWHGSPWHFVVDGTDHVIQETSTQDPLHPAPFSIFLPPVPFPIPLNWTWSATKGADLIWTPIPFERSFQMAYTRTHYGTGYYIYDRFAPGTPLSHPLRTWNESPPATDVLDLIARSGTDIAPKAGCKSDSGKFDLPAHGAIDVVRLQGKATIRALVFSIPRGEAPDFEHVRLRIAWDGRDEPSVDAPVALFYGAGTLFNRDNREYLVKAFPVHIRFSKDRVYLACYFPMPFFRSARIELSGAGHAVKDVEWQVRYMPLREPANRLAYFHATYRDIPHPVAGKDMVLLDTRKAEGGGDWSGQFVGTSFIFSHEANLTTLEGDPRFFFDDSETPQAQGTGTEEWAGGGDYWGGQDMSLPFVGHPVGARSPQTAVNAEDKIESAYRFLLADAMPFGKNAVIRLEHGGTNESTQHYETVTYWYGLPAASLVKTDEIHMGRIDRGSSDFRLRLRPDNLGVLLRRKLDDSFANQRAEIYVAGPSKSAWRFAGIWYLAGSNTVVYSNPKDELGATEHIVETANQHVRDDEFLISRKLTAGRNAIWIRVKFTPVNRPLYPGYPLGKQAWSASDYTAYCFVAPRFSVK